MQLKTVKIKNYKSYCEQDNLLIVDDINAIIGKNESGKSNLIEAISFINYKGVDNSFFTKYNRNVNNEVEISISLKSKTIEDTILTFKKENVIEISGGLSEFILNDTTFQSNLNNIIDNKNKINIDGNSRPWFYEILSKISDCDKEIFIYDNSRLKSVISILNSKIETKEYAKNLNFCINYLNKIYDKFPQIIKVTNDELKTVYLRNTIEDDKDKKIVLTNLLNCVGYNIEDIKKYWKLPNQSEKADFEDEFKTKIMEFVEKFNKFYGQDRVQLIPSLDTTGLYFNIKTKGKRIGLEERSNGLRWYLSIYIQIKSKIKEAALKNCVIVIDEPGVYLHVDAQKKLKELFEDFIKDGNQIIYTTHSPFMIFAEKLYRTKLIIKDEDGNTHISNKYYDTPHKIKSKSETISPMMSAIGMSMNYHLLGEEGKINIITEGISDYHYIKSYLIQKKLDNKYNIIPSAGVSNVNRLASILIGWNCKIRVVLDQDQAGRTEYKKLAEELMIDSKHIIFTNFSQIPEKTVNSPIEDLFSLEDKSKIGINNEDYNDEKASYSLSLLGKVQNNTEKLSEQTIRNFDELFKNLNLEI